MLFLLLIACVDGKPVDTAADTDTDTAADTATSACGTVAELDHPPHPTALAIEADPPPIGMLWTDATCALPLHGGPSYVRRHADRDGSLASWQIGCDYNHEYDKRFTFAATPEDAAEVFADAAKLADWLREHP